MLGNLTALVEDVLNSGERGPDDVLSGSYDPYSYAIHRHAWPEPYGDAAHKQAFNDASVKGGEDEVFSWFCGSHMSIITAVHISAFFSYSIKAL